MKGEKKNLDMIGGVRKLASFELKLFFPIVIGITTVDINWLKIRLVNTDDQACMG